MHKGVLITTGRQRRSSANNSGLDRVSRRSLLKGGASVGVGGALAVMGVGSKQAAAVEAVGDIAWDAVADVVIIGAGASGLPAAIAAADAGASVIVIEAHFDVGGRAIYSGGSVELGGGHSLQQQHGVEDSADRFIRRLD